MIQLFDGVLRILTNAKEVLRTLEAMLLVALLVGTSNPAALLQMAMTALVAWWPRGTARNATAGNAQAGNATPRRQTAARGAAPAVSRWRGPLPMFAALLLGTMAVGMLRVPAALPAPAPSAALVESMQREVERAELAVAVLDGDDGPVLASHIRYWRAAAVAGDSVAQLRQLTAIQQVLASAERARHHRALELADLELALRDDADRVDAVVTAALPLLDARSRIQLAQLQRAAGTKADKAARIAALLADRAQSYSLPLPLRASGPIGAGPDASAMRPADQPDSGTAAADPAPVAPPPTASAPAPLDPRPRDLTPTDGAWSKDAGAVGLVGAALPLPPTDPALVAPVLDTNALAALELPIVASLAANAPIDGRLVVAALVREPQATALLCFGYDPELAGDGDGGGVVGAPVRLAVLATGTKVTLRGVAARAGAVVGEVADGSAQTTTVWPFDGRAPVRVDGRCLGAFDGGTFVGLVQQIADGSRRWLVLPLDGSTPVDQPIELDAAAIAALLAAPSAAPTPTP